MEFFKDHLNLTRHIILRITHDLINPLGAMSMMIDDINEHKDMISESLDDAINILEIVRSIFNPSLTLSHAQKISNKYIQDVSWNIENDIGNVAAIMLTLSFISMQKQQKSVINLLKNEINIDLALSNEELDALHLRENSLSSYTSYIYLVAILSKENSYNIIYDNNSLTIKL